MLPPLSLRRPHRRRVALATYAELPLLAEVERPLIPALGDVGVDAEPVVWSDSGTDWRRFDGVVLRSCWDYHRRVAEFRRWLDRLEALGIPVWNPTPALRWNLDKRYLADLRAHGVNVVPTVWLPRGSSPDVNAMLRLTRWRHVVVKPTVSASGHETWTAAPPLSPAELERIRAMLVADGVMLQPLVEEVRRDGELSIVLLDGKFSHAVRKRAAQGEFRVQNQFGGSSELVEVPRGVVRLASRIVELIPVPLLYARVDGVISAGRFLVMELEVAEPSLFLELADGAYDNVARLIRGRLIGAGVAHGRQRHQRAS